MNQQTLWTSIAKGVILEFDRNAIRTVTAPATVQNEETTTETVEETEEKE